MVAGSKRGGSQGLTPTQMDLMTRNLAKNEEKGRKLFESNWGYLTEKAEPPHFRRPHVVVATKYYFDRHVQHAATLRQQRIPLYGTYIEDFEAPRVNTPEEWNTISVALRQPLHAHSTKAFTRPVYRPTSATYGSRPPIDNMKKALEGEELLKSLLAQSQTLASSTVLATQQ